MKGRGALISRADPPRPSPSSRETPHTHARQVDVTDARRRVHSLASALSTSPPCTRSRGAPTSRRSSSSTRPSSTSRRCAGCHRRAAWSRAVVFGTGFLAVAVDSLALSFGGGGLLAFSPLHHASPRAQRSGARLALAVGVRWLSRRHDGCGCLPRRHAIRAPAAAAFCVRSPPPPPWRVVAARDSAARRH
jgi:hypothetical protein